MKAKIEIPENLIAIGFFHNTEIAWQKKDLDIAFDFCINEAAAISGGEAWIVKSVDANKRGEPTEVIQNLNPDSKLSLLAQNSTHYIYGIFPLQSGQSAVLSWDTKSFYSQAFWIKYVKEPINETRDIINKANLENDVIHEYKRCIFYNLQFQCKDGTSI